MQDVTGALQVDHEGRSYTLRLTMEGMAALQGRFKNDLEAMLTGTLVGFPSFYLLLGIVKQALIKGSGLTDEDAGSLADALLTADRSLAVKIMNAAFPDASGNVEAPKKRSR